VNRGLGIRVLNFGREAQTKAHAWGVNEAPVWHARRGLQVPLERDSAELLKK